jgi:hypothetical protein
VSDPAADAEFCITRSTIDCKLPDTEPDPIVDINNDNDWEVICCWFPSSAIVASVEEV